MFVDADGPDGKSGTEDDDLRLQMISPAIDAGDNAVLPSDIHDLDGDGDTFEWIPIDLDVHVRVYDGGSGQAAVDMGVFEFDAPPVVLGSDSFAPER